ncbi:MAG: DEAD/DEAH box helicase, partial [Phycisphaeraceae bacterium]|nr:DEAD/DEAH box helicase [Phycisphaeraceae bacterium]
MPIEAEDILAPDGPIARRLGDRYEQRPEQQQMIEAVRETLAEGGHLAVEAGTGVGKSFAYLLPALEHLLADRDLGRKRRVVVSTHTIALQEQLVEKDLPLLQAVIGDEFSAVLVKGRSNYISLRRFKRAWERQGKLFDDPRLVRSLEKIESWVRTTDDGSLASLGQLPSMKVWDQVQSDAGNCMGKRCPTYEECFYQSARRRMEHADLLVVNHALFFADLALRAEGVGFLPPYDHVILDEAHTVEDVASSHFGLRVTEAGVRRLLGSIYSTRTQKGYLPSLKGRVDAPAIDRAIRDAIAADDACTTFFDDVTRWRDARPAGTGRLHDAGFVENPLTPALNDLEISLKRLRDQVDRDADRFEIAGYAGRCAATGTSARALVQQEEADSVYWLDVSRTGRRRRVELACSPIEVGPLLEERLFESTGPDGDSVGVVLTSATLTTGTGEKAFDHLRRRLGCGSARTLQLGSPFDYARQATLWVHPELPEPNRNEYVPEIGPIILDHLVRTDGGAFVLFTGYDMLRQVRRWLEPHLKER